MTYSIRIGFLLAILSVIFGAGLYLRAQPTVYVHPTSGVSHAQSITPPILNNPPWVGDLENADVFKHFLRQAVNVKILITLWPHNSSVVHAQKITAQPVSEITLDNPTLNFLQLFTDVKTEGLKLLWPNAKIIVQKATTLAQHHPLAFLPLSERIVGIKTQILNLLWPHTPSHVAIQHNHPSDGLFLIETQKVSLKKLIFTPSYVVMTDQMKKGLFPHRYLHIIRPIIIEGTPAVSKSISFSQSFANFLSMMDFFKTNVLHVLNITWEYPFSVGQHNTDAKKIVFLPEKYTFARPPASSQSPLSLAPIVVQSAALMGDVGHTQLILRLSQKPFYIVRTDPSHQTITLAIDNINSDISSIPPLDTQGTAIQNVTFNVTPDNQLLISLTLFPQTDVQGLRYKENNLIIDVGLGATVPYVTSDTNAKIASPGIVQPLVKTPVPLTDSQLAAENYDEAVDLLNQGNTQGAIGMLQMVVAQHPTYLEGRVLLAELLLQQNEAQQALTVLKGVASQPNFSDSITYYSLLAESYRQTGDFKSAIGVYQQLLQLHPSNGVWWVGLGMCFEGLGQVSAATESYQKALATATLSPVLQTFVSKKIGETQ